MNIIQQHERARFLLDRVATARFGSEDVDNALNGEIELIVREKYDQGRLQNRSDALQRTQRVRDELRPLMKFADKLNGLSLYPSIDQRTLLAMFGSILGGDPDITDYRYLITMRVEDSAGTFYPVFPLASNMKTVYKRNPFRRTRLEPISKFYYTESNLGGDAQWEVHMVLPTGVTFEDLIIEYLKDPTTVNYGVEYDSAKTFANGTKLIAVEETVYAGATYVIGERITIANPNYSITSGLVVANFVETELPASLHEEICRRAASSLLISVGESEKAKAILSQIIAT